MTIRSPHRSGGLPHGWGTQIKKALRPQTAHAAAEQAAGTATVTVTGTGTAEATPAEEPAAPLTMGVNMMLGHGPWPHCAAHEGRIWFCAALAGGGPSYVDFVNNAQTPAVGGCWGQYVPDYQ